VSRAVAGISTVGTSVNGGRRMVARIVRPRYSRFDGITPLNSSDTAVTVNRQTPEATPFAFAFFNGFFPHYPDHCLPVRRLPLDRFERNPVDTTTDDDGVNSHTRPLSDSRGIVNAPSGILASAPVEDVIIAAASAGRAPAGNFGGPGGAARRGDHGMELGAGTEGTGCVNESEGSYCYTPANGGEPSSPRVCRAARFGCAV
jgi:hypothetical protein